MGFGAIVLLCSILPLGIANVEINNSEYQDILESVTEALKDGRFNEEIAFDLKKENQIYTNRTTTLLMKYIIKREVDNYRTKRTEAIRRRVYSTIIMKLIDIGKDLARNESTDKRIDRAHKLYSSVKNNDIHDTMADIQVFHYMARLYEIMVTAPKILIALGNFNELTPVILAKKLEAIQVKPVQLGVVLLIQYYLRSTLNFAVESNAIQILSTKPSALGPQVVDVLKALASRLLPVSELLDIHLAYSSPMFKDNCPSTWLGIIHRKN